MNIVSYPVDLINLDQAVHIVEQAWQANKGLHIITINAEMIVAAQKDSRLDQIMRHADLVIPDGAGVVLAAKLNGRNIDRLPGIELAQTCLHKAAALGIPVVLLGGDKDVLSELSSSLPEKYPGLKLSFCQDGYFSSQNEQSIIENISKSNAQLVLVAMGVPRQEYFIEQARQIAQYAVFIGVGGSFDVWAGKKQRAPQIWQDCHLEWLYRLICEPWRFKRMASALPNFAYQAIIERLRKVF